MRPRPLLRARDALDQLLLDHERVRALLRQYDRVRLTGEMAPERSAELLDSLCDALTLLAQMEEDFFYPAVRQTLGEHMPAPTVFCDHARLRSLIAELDELPPGDRACDAVVADMGDCVVPCMNAAGGALFGPVREAGLDTYALGMQMALWRREQKAQVIKRVPRQPSSKWLAASGWPQPVGLGSA